LALPITTTRAAILVNQHEPLVLDDITLPEALEPGQVLVRVVCSGVCGSQVGEIDGVKGKDKWLPHLLGHEGGARVLAVGPGVKHVAQGDHVVMHWRPGPGIEAAPPKYAWRGEQLNAGWVTTFNEHAIVSENRVTRIDPTFRLDQAALFGCPVTTGLGLVTRDAQVRLGDSVVVLGAGGVGLSVVQGAAMSGAWPIVAIDLHQAKLDLAKQLGATHALLGGRDDMAAAIRELVGKAGADVIVENTGNPRIIEMAYGLTAREGRLVLVGVPRTGENISIHSLPLHFGKVVTGSHGGGTEPAIDIPRYVRLVQAGRLDLSSLITHRFALEQINDAIDMLRRGAITGRAVVEMGDADGGGA
jgi:S-(hydroxymethyl)glutathione dehydrogenase/alcohol dehydrogenase